MTEQKDIIKKGYGFAAQTTKKHAASFYFCSLFLKKEKRLASYAVYAFSRMLDDAFDSPSAGSGEDRIRLWSDSIHSVYSEKPPDSPLLLCLRSTVNKYGIPIEYFLDLIKGMEMDLVEKNYRDFSELYTYCYRVAGVVGLIMVKIFGSSDDRALLFAEKMGIAMQLTNILRDIKDDLSMGRVYLPEEELARYEINHEQLGSGIVNENFSEFMRFQIKRARSFYKEAAEGIRFLDDANSRFIASLMGVIYSGILDSIIKNNYDVFTKRAYVPWTEKVRLTSELLFARLSGD